MESPSYARQLVDQLVESPSYAGASSHVLDTPYLSSRPPPHDTPMDSPRLNPPKPLLFEPSYGDELAQAFDYVPVVSTPQTFASSSSPRRPELPMSARGTRPMSANARPIDWRRRPVPNTSTPRTRPLERDVARGLNTLGSEIGHLVRTSPRSRPVIRNDELEWLNHNLQKVGRRPEFDEADEEDEAFVRPRLKPPFNKAKPGTEAQAKAAQAALTRTLSEAKAALGMSTRDTLVDVAALLSTHILAHIRPERVCGLAPEAPESARSSTSRVCTSPPTSVRLSINRAFDRVRVPSSSSSDQHDPSASQLGDRKKKSTRKSDVWLEDVYELGGNGATPESYRQHAAEVLSLYEAATELVHGVSLSNDIRAINYFSSLVPEEQRPEICSANGDVFVRVTRGTTNLKARNIEEARKARSDSMGFGEANGRFARSLRRFEPTNRTSSAERQGAQPNRGFEQSLKFAVKSARVADVAAAKSYGRAKGRSEQPKQSFSERLLG